MYYPEILLIMEDKCLEQYFESLSFAAPESFYVLDVQQKRICYVKSEDLFLCGFTTENALHLNKDFYSKIIHSDDLPLCIDMYKATLKYIKENEFEQDKISYFSCNFRLLHKYSFSSHYLSLMIYHKMKPFWTNGVLMYLLCCVENSTVNNAGNLCLHYKNGNSYKEYNLKTKRWKENIKNVLTEREKVILLLAQQGKNSSEIGNLLCRGHNTIRNQMKNLYLKLKRHSMQEAIEFTRNFL